MLQVLAEHFNLRDTLPDCATNQSRQKGEGMGKGLKIRRRSQQKRSLPEQWRPYASTRKAPRIWQGAIAAAVPGGLISVDG